jgi:acetoin utilization deacetylase AcuC-like enzyme
VKSAAAEAGEFTPFHSPSGRPTRVAADGAATLGRQEVAAQVSGRIAVFFDPAAVAQTDSFSPSARKPALAVQAWRAAGLPIEVLPVEPASPEDLALAHEPGYVRRILACEEANGFGNRSAQVARSLPFTTGAMLCAARHALVHGIACAPVSGFHHAGYASAGGFCTFNGLMVTAVKLLGEAAVGSVLILDCDMHFGDGTAQILRRLDLADRITHLTYGERFTQPEQGLAYLEALAGDVERMAEHDLVLYQAGADVHVDDPLGGVLGTAQMRERDRLVFDAARRHCTPLAWNLAGGYQEPVSLVLGLHTTTMRVCAAAFAVRPPGQS